MLEWHHQLVGHVLLLLEMDLLVVFTKDAVDIEGDNLSHLSLLSLLVEEFLETLNLRVSQRNILLEAIRKDCICKDLKINNLPDNLHDRLPR